MATDGVRKGTGRANRGDDGDIDLTSTFKDKSGRKLSSTYQGQRGTESQFDVNTLLNMVNQTGMQHVNINGVDHLALTPQAAASQGIPTSNLKFDKALGVYTVPWKDFVTAHPSSAEGFNKFGPLLAGAGLLAVTAPAIAAGAGAVEGGATGALAEGATVSGSGVGGGAGGVVEGGFSGLGTGSPDLWSQAVGGLNAETQGILNSVGAGATPGVTPATTGGFTAGQLTAAGVNPASVGLPAIAGPAASVGGAVTGGLSGGGSGPSVPSLPGGLGGLGNVLGGAVTSIGGALAGDSIGDAYRDVENQYLAIGAPYRNLLESSYKPNFDLWNQPGYSGAFDEAAERASRAVSARSGNPFGNPGAMGEISSSVLNNAYLPALSNYRGQLGQFGGMGLNTAGGASMGEAGSAGMGWEALGSGLGQIFNPQPNFNDFLKQFGGGNFSLNIGGMRQ